MRNELKISEILKDLGVPANVSGYFYLKIAVDMMIKDISLINKITKELYPSIAKRFNTTASCVERAIRHAIEVGWGRGNTTTQNRLFGYTIDTEKCRPTNSEFIVTVADWFNMTEHNKNKK